MRRSRLTLVLGTGDLARSIRAALREARPEAAVELVAWAAALDDCGPALRSASELEQYLLTRQPERIVLATSRARRVAVEALLRPLATGIRVENGRDFYERLTGKLPIDKTAPNWLLSARALRKPFLYRALRRGSDFALAVVLLLVLAPLLLLIALAVALDSPGGVLLRQERIGLGGRRFLMWKFRTMRADAEKDTGAVWARHNDQRVTRTGSFLRRTHLDELPQLVNVVRGDMALIGPRPERPHFVTQLEQALPLYSQRHVVRPGITGWAQTCYRYGASVQDAAEKLAYDLFYVKHRSFWLDLQILLLTVALAITGKGAR